MSASHTPPTYKTPGELGITPEEHAGLIAVMEHLRAPQVVHAATDTFIFAGDIPHHRTVRVGFNMAISSGAADRFEAYDCGCVACIGGHLSMYLQGIPVIGATEVLITREQEAKIDDYVSDRENSALRDLFYPDEIDRDGRWGQLTPATAADAISNFLTTGYPNWAEAALRNGQGDLLSHEGA